MKLSDVKPGMTLVADGGFTCLTLGQHVVVKVGEDDLPYVPCLSGRHYLAGQKDGEGNLIGFTLASDPDPIPGAF